MKSYESCTPLRRTRRTQSSLLFFPRLAGRWCALALQLAGHDLLDATTCHLVSLFFTLFSLSFTSRRFPAMTDQHRLVSSVQPNRHNLVSESSTSYRAREHF